VEADSGVGDEGGGVIERHQIPEVWDVDRWPSRPIRWEEDRPEGNAMNAVVLVCGVYVVAGVVLAVILN